MAQTVQLETFIDDIVRTQNRSREDVERELVTAAHGAVVAHFGDATPVEVTLDPGAYVLVHQILQVVETVTNPKREIALLAAKRIAPDIVAGEEIAVPILYTYAEAGAANEPWRDSVPLPLHDVTLEDALSEHLSRAVQRYYPARSHAEDTLGHLLKSNGGWARGVVGAVGDTTVEIAGAFMRVTSISPTHEWVDYGFDLVVRTRGATCELRIDRGDNEGNVRGQLELPTNAASRGVMEDMLARLATEIVDGLAKEREPDLPADWHDKLRFINGYTWTPSLMLATLKRPAPGSLMEYLGPALQSALGGYSCRVPLPGGSVTFRTFRVFSPEIGLGDFGLAAHRLVAEVEGGESAPDLSDQSGDVLQLGSLSLAALDHPGPRTADEIRDVQALIATYREWLDAHLHHHAKISGLAGYTSFNFFYAFPGYFPLMKLIEQRMTMGPPGPPPVPAFSDEALVLAGRTLMPVRGAALTELARSLKTPQLGEVPPGIAQSAIFAAYAANGWRIVLSDERSGPFRIPEIVILPPEGGRAATVMMVDAWNPQARTVVDGDAFAFRRFVTWLREAILRGGHDQTVRFEGDAEHDDLEEEPAEDEASEDAQPRAREIRVSEWLLFDMPDFGDRFLVDWRAQWHIVNAIGRSEDFASIYGFTREYVEQLRSHDIPLWRRFLREVIDPRFDRTVGAELAR